MKKLLTNIINFIYPNHCLLCDQAILEESLFCLNHYKKVKFITSPKCEICSKPLNNQMNKVKCIKCLYKTPFYDSSIIIFSYEKYISNMILSFKYNDNTYICKKLAKIFTKRLKKEPILDIITAIPLHKKRLKERKYNQSLILAKNIAKNLEKTVFIPDLLIRTKFTKTQEGLDERERLKNLENAFILNPKYQYLVKNKAILLTDDVVTSGATVNSCAKVLKKSGASLVKVAGIAKA